MKTIKNEEIKARVDGRTKTELAIMAADKGLDVSDVIREAIRDFICKQQQSRQNVAA